ncbi:NAD-dependent epimerase/dehydratase family protein [Deltaproteobacteria bacterium TL4]
MKTFLITGGAGFVGSSLAIALKQNYENIKVIALDNLKRRGSELSLNRFREHGVEFVHGDIRNPEDLAFAAVDVLIECSAEPSVLAGYGESPAYLLNTNLLGTLHCLELARKTKAQFLFLSTSRVYPVKTLNELEYLELSTRFEWKRHQAIPGSSNQGITEQFPLNGARSLYGTTKLASELIIQEYVEMYGLEAIINRCGLLAGPWQMGKTDQGVITLWVAKHFFKKELAYIGYGGTGKQVRDVLHIEDLFSLVKLQLEHFSEWSGEIFNVGGGLRGSVSLRELTQLCEDWTQTKIPIKAIPENRPADLRLYITDHDYVSQKTGWKPQSLVTQVVQDIARWIEQNHALLKPILDP